MAAGFKQATVTAADVPSSQTNFPVYVDLSRVGITTLAEAESVRCYSDSGKTTELAREIVSASEMHVLIPSLTNTFTLYVDYDGVRADYAVTDTYGRNAVWVDYDGVFHLQEASGSITNSTGGTSLTTSGSPTYSAASQIGDGIDYSAFADRHTVASAGGTNIEPVTIQAWFNADVTSGANGIAGVGTAGSTSTGEQCLVIVNGKLWALSQLSANVQATGATTVSANTWYMGHGVFANDSSREVFLNGSSDGTNTSTIVIPGSTGFVVGARFSGSQFLNGTVDEVRFRASVLSANWITTEYNNQSDEAGFWGTWTDVGGGPVSTFVPRAIVI